MLGKASPRKPSVVICSRSSRALILLVACRVKQCTASAVSMPRPSSSTWISSVPPPCTSTLMLRACASMAFSRSSLTTDAGRSITSPAAIWLTTASGSVCTRPMAWLLADLAASADVGHLQLGEQILQHLLFLPRQIALRFLSQHHEQIDHMLGLREIAHVLL